MAELQSLTGPVLTFVGTIAVAALGYYQWRKQHSKPNRSAVAESRRKAAEAIWSQLEEINLKLRPFGEDRRAIDIRGELRSLNELFLRNSLYLNDSLQACLNSYVKQLHRVSERIAEYQEGHEEWATSAINPSVGKYGAVYSEIEALQTQRESVKRMLLSATDG